MSALLYDAVGNDPQGGKVLVSARAQLCEAPSESHSVRV